MTVRELIETLQAMDCPDAILICSRDSEGNAYSPLGKANTGFYEAHSPWAGAPALKELTLELIGHGFSEDDVVDDAEPAVFLVPIA